MLTLNNLTYLYQHLPMRFSLHAGRGERLAILGPSGAGKSTLLNLIAGFLPVSQGSLIMDGVDHTHSVPAQRPVSMLFQENNLFPHLSVEQNLGLGLHPGLRLTADQRQQVATIAQQVGLSEMLSRLPGQLSGGQRQRVALARCCASGRYYCWMNLSRRLIRHCVARCSTWCVPSAKPVKSHYLWCRTVLKMRSRLRHAAWWW